MNNYENELEIDLKDLFFWLLRIWHIFVICLLLGVVLGCSYAAIKNIQFTNTDHEQDIVNAKEKLTPKEITEVDDIISGMAFAKEKQDALTEDMISSHYAGDDLEDAIKRVDYWNSIYNQHYSKSRSLTKEQAEYYNLIEYYDPDKEPEQVSYAKSAILGGLVVVIFVAAIYCIIYIFTPTVKTAEELSYTYRSPVLSALTPDEKKAEEMLTADLSIIAGNNPSKIALLFDNDSELETELATRLVESCGVSAFDPLSSPDALRKLSACEAAVIIATTKCTKRPRLRSIIEHCSRYDCKLSGFVAILTK